MEQADGLLHFCVVAGVSLGRNAVYLTVEKAVHTAGGLVAMVLVARILGAGALADYGFAISLAAFFIPFLDVGMNNRIIKGVAGGRPIGETVEEVLAFKLGVAPLIFGLMVAGGLIWGDARVSGLVALVGVSTIAMTTGDAANAVFKGLHRSGISCALIAGLNVALVGSLAWTLLAGGGLAAVGWCYALTRLAYAAAAFTVLGRVSPDGAIPVRIGFDRDTIVDGIFHLPAGYFLGNLLYLAYLVTYVMFPFEAGAYYVGYRAASAVYVLVSAGFEAVLARTVSDGSRPSGLGGWFVTYSVIAVLLLFLAAPLAPVVMGGDLQGSVRSVRLLASCVPSFALCGLAHTFLMAVGRERFGTAVLGGLLAGGLVLSVVSGHAWGLEGTALVPACASLVAMGILWKALSSQAARSV